MVKTAAQFITDKLAYLIVLSGIMGYLAAPLANNLSVTTPYLLAIMVAGTGFNLSLRQVFSISGTARLTLLTLVAQLGLLPLLGYGLYLLVPDPGLALGMVALGVAPCEITSALMTLLAKGELALATRLMAFSVFLAAFLTPLWFGLFLGKSAGIDFGGMAIELGLIITLPFLVSSALRSRFERLSQYETEFGALSAAAVIVLIFIVGSTLAGQKLEGGLVWLVVACIVFNLAGYGLGWLLSRLFRLDRPRSSALIFTSGMREFGIATAVAIDFLPAGATIAPALYGLIMMISASLLASRLKKSSELSPPQLVIANS